MPLSDTEFLRFIILVIPGFWGLRVYKAFIGKSNEKGAGDNDLWFSVGFGFLGYVLISSFPMLSALPLILQVAISSIVSIALASALGIANRRGIYPSFYPAVWHSKRNSLPIPTPNFSGLDYIWNTWINDVPDKDERTCVAMVYSPGERSKAEIGEVVSFSGVNNELTLDTRPPLTVADIDSNDWAISPRLRYVSTENNMIVEIANIKTSVIDEIQRAYHAAILSGE